MVYKNNPAAVSADFEWQLLRPAQGLSYGSVAPWWRHQQHKTTAAGP
jgi:hypothetical protein